MFLSFFRKTQCASVSRSQFLEVGDLLGKG